MASKAIIGLIFGLLLGRAVCGAEEPHQEFVCRSPTEERAIRLYSRFDAHSQHGCRVEYSKGGRARVLWSSQSSSTYCVSKVTHLVTVLSQDNFKCTPRTIEAAEPD